MDQEFTFHLTLVYFYGQVDFDAVETDGRLAPPRHTVTTRLEAVCRRLSATPWRDVSAYPQSVPSLNAALWRTGGPMENIPTPSLKI
jgi:hypothetical protein